MLLFAGIDLEKSFAVRIRAAQDRVFALRAREQLAPEVSLARQRAENDLADLERIKKERLAGLSRLTIARHGPWGGLTEEVRYWGNWMLKKVKAEIGDLYPLIPDPEYRGERPKIQPNLWPSVETAQVPPGYLVPVAYLWTRTVKCKNPLCGATVPFVRQTWLCKKKGRYVALKIIAPPSEKQVRFQVVETINETDLGFIPETSSKGGNATCHFCGTVADTAYVKAEGC